VTALAGGTQLLSLHGVERHYRSAEGGFTLRIPALQIAAGECVVVLGPSGSGKSTLLDLLAFLAGPTRAETFTLTVDEVCHDVAASWRGARERLVGLRARHIGYVLQTGGLLPYLSVGENIQLSRRLLGLAGTGTLAPLLESLGIASLMGRRPGQLSVGQRQRVALARALAHAPALVLADEPTAALDAGMALTVADALAAATRASGAALVVVTHDPTIAARLGGRTIACRADAQPGVAVLDA
jgi:putative ABC transport system ATP-binding protein